MSDINKKKKGAEIVKRMMDDLGEKSYASLTRRLGLNSTAVVGNWIARGMVPQRTLESISEETGKPIDWYLKGTDLVERQSVHTLESTPLAPIYSDAQAYQSNNHRGHISIPGIPEGAIAIVTESVECHSSIYFTDEKKHTTFVCHPLGDSFDDSQIENGQLLIVNLPGTNVFYAVRYLVTENDHKFVYINNNYEYFPADTYSRNLISEHGELISKGTKLAEELRKSEGSQEPPPPRQESPPHEHKFIAVVEMAIAMNMLGPKSAREYSQHVSFQLKKDIDHFKKLLE